MPSDSYVIPLDKVYTNKPRTRRADNAISVIYSFMKKHTRKDRKDIVLSNEVNEYVWKRSIQKPPRKIEVSLRNEDGKVYVFLKDSKAFKEFRKAHESKKAPEKKGTATKTKPEAPEKKATATKAKPEEKEKTPAVEKGKAEEILDKKVKE